MSITYKKIAGLVFSMAIVLTGFSQQVFKGKIIDSLTKEPISGVSVHCSASGCGCGCATNVSGEYTLTPKENCCKSFIISSIGYRSVSISYPATNDLVQLQQDNSAMQMVVVSANRDAVKRSLAPVAISSISSKQIQETKPITIDQMLNKVSGVYMVNLGNEQHSMSIRQPMTTKSLFLYLEDGIPIRTTGLFNHNALLEINMASTKNIEVIKGPSSSLYGSEAIGGVVNFITIAPTTLPVAKLSLQRNNIGYKRTDVQTSFSNGKWGFAVSGYYADKRNSFIEYTDFNKATLSARADYRFSEKTMLTNSITILDYYSDMTGGIDSIMYSNKSFSSNQTFTYRKVNAIRYHSTLTHSWNEQSKTTASLIYRKNAIGQNPAYAIKDDYRRLNNGTWIGQKDLAHGEINESSFNSYSMILQHRQSFDWKKAMLIVGSTMDLSPSGYSASYIRVNKDSVTKTYTSYEASDSMLASYTNGINNYAAFVSGEFSPVEKLRIVASIRYDLFRYNFDNNLKPSSFSGSPDTINNFQRLSPKIGFTYNFSSRTGIYFNYSEGFVPPQVTEMYKGVKVPDLKPTVFYNYEIGGWAEIVKGKLSADISVYRLSGNNEIISVRMDDGSSQNMNAGKTIHKGIELGIQSNPSKTINFRYSAAYNKHLFTEFIEKGTSYNGNEMNGAPRWMNNAEIWYRPVFLKGLRLGAEWQMIGSYYMDPQNTTKYEGYNVFHIRAGYQHKAIEFWFNIINVANSYYAYTSSKSSFGYSYTPAEPRNFVAGLSYDFGNLFKRNKK